MHICIYIYIYITKLLETFRKLLLWIWLRLVNLRMTSSLSVFVNANSSKKLFRKTYLIEFSTSEGKLGGVILPTNKSKCRLWCTYGRPNIKNSAGTQVHIYKNHGLWNFNLRVSKHLYCDFCYIILNDWYIWNGSFSTHVFAMVLFLRRSCTFLFNKWAKSLVFINYGRPENLAHLSKCFSWPG